MEERLAVESKKDGRKIMKIPCYFTGISFTFTPKHMKPSHTLLNSNPLAYAHEFDWEVTRL